jgi:RNA polymerase sigma factor (sigma-70 family)
MPSSHDPSLRFLDRGRELELIRRWQERRCPQARAELAAAYQPLVQRIARSYHLRFNRCVPASDLAQEGNIGLLTALDRFDAGLGHRFGTYAQWWIAAGIRGALRSAGHLARSAAEPGGEDAEDKAAGAAGLPVLLSLDAAPSGEEAGGSLLDRLSDEGLAQDAMLAGRYADQLRTVMTGLLDGLDETLRRIVVDRFCAEDARPRATVASELGLSLYEVRAGENRALDALRRAARAKGLSPEDLQPA